jgi:NAD(P)-dependent dehydrogenase (short-subunit alcohol dehydrogenase family)
MKNFEGKVAVVTGAASGIGRALAERFAVERMKVVLADIEPEPLRRTAAEMEALGADVIAVECDVADAAQVAALAQTTLDAFGGVHLLCNNAGVSGRLGPLWTQTNADWDWVLGVNLRGVIHGIQSFVPLMVERGEDGHVVNTAAAAGLVPLPNTGVYNVSNHAIIALSETLHHELSLVGAKVKVSVVCPGFVNTRIHESARFRPAVEAESPPADDRWQEELRRAVAGGLPPELVAHRVMEAVIEERLYVLTHPELKTALQRRLGEIVDEKNPELVPWF